MRQWPRRFGLAVEIGASSAVLPVLSDTILMVGGLALGASLARSIIRVGVVSLVKELLVFFLRLLELE